LQTRGADLGRLFSDAAAENQRVQTTWGRRKGANPLLDLTAEPRDRLGCLKIFALKLQQVTHFRTAHPPQE